MAEAIPFSIVTNLITKLGAIAFNEICLVYGVEDELEKLKDTLSTIEAALLDADQGKEKSNLMKDWIRKLNGAVYDADDLLDAFATKSLQRDGSNNMKKVREFFSSSNQLAFRYKLGRRIKEMRERFDEIAANMSKFDFTETGLAVQASVENSVRETISFVLTSDIIGREKDKEAILKLIMSTRSNEENVTVITIVGMGGLGKTALAQLVYNDEKVVEYFGLRLWVCVSVDFEQKSLVKKILKSLTNNEVGDLELEQLQIRLRENLDGKRFLLVLDDIWNEIPQKWELVKILLMGGAKGSKIVVTTRSRKVASVMGTESPYILKGLSDEQSLTLFEKVAFGGHESVQSNLVVIVKEIIEKCKGVPLAIQSLASIMRSKTQESEWLSIRNSDVWSLCQDDGDILPILRLSYDHLPIQLRQCFAFCSIFPKDHEIEKELLIQLWMAQSYIQSSNNSQCLEDIGDQYFRNLLSRSFFQDSKVNDYNEVISCKMHDLVHDLATRVAGSDCTIAETYEDNISNRVRHVSIVYRPEELPRQMLKAKGLRTFLSTGDDAYYYSRQTSICRILMSPNFTCLRVLDVHGRWVRKVLSSIGELQHLRYLDLSRNNIKSLPNSIRKLVNLQTLKLSGCNLLERLPEGITKLINLRYLVTDGCSRLKYMPSGMGKLTSLRKLDKFVMRLGGNKWGVRLSELSGLNELRDNTCIKGLENVKNVGWESKEANLMAKQYLHSLTLEWAMASGNEFIGSSEFVDRDIDEILLEGLQPHPKLRELSIDGYRGRMFPSWMMKTGNIVSSLPNIVCITMYNCDRCEHVPPSLDQLPFLKFLKLERLSRVEHISDKNNNDYRVEEMSVFFPSLEELVIQNLPNLKGWWRAAAAEEEEEEERASESSQHPSFPRLTTLVIVSCPNLTSMPIHLPHLEKLDVWSVPEKLVRQLLLLLLTTPPSASSSSSITQGSAASSSSSTSYSSIPTAIISSKLKYLSITDIKDLDSPLPMEVLRNLASLETLEISWCPILSSCFVLGSEKEEEEGFFRALLPSLCSLEIFKCDSLTSFVVSGPGGVTLHLTALQHLTISNCPNFDFSGDHGVYWQGMRNILNLTIKKIPKLVSLPVGLQQLTTLQHLKILYCPGLMALAHWLTNLTSLQSLEIYECRVLSERCQKETGEDWSIISHIPYILIDWKTIQH